MATTTQITDVAQYFTAPADVAGELGADYDLTSAQADMVTAMDDAAGEGITVTASGTVFADLDQADRARDIDWAELADSIDVSGILARHER